MNAEKLTQKSIDAVRKAQSIAVMKSNSVIEPIHLLAGLVRQENGLITQLLKKMNIDEDIFDGEIEKKIDIVKANYYTDDQLFIHEVALFKISTPVLLENPEVSRTIRRHDARMIEVNPTYSTVLIASLTEDIANLFQQLKSMGCLLQFTRSGRIAVTR